MTDSPSPAPGKSPRGRYFYIGLTAFLVIAASMLFFFLLFRIDKISGFFFKILDILSPIITGFVFAYILNPMMMAFEKQINLLCEGRVKKPKKVRRAARAVSVGLCLTVALLLLYILGNMIAPELYASIVNLVKDLPGQIDTLTDNLSNFVKNNSTLTQIVENVTVQSLDYFKNWLQSDLLEQANVIANYLTVGVKGVYNFVMNFVVGIIVCAYLLFSKETFLGQIKKLLYVCIRPKTAGIIIDTTKKANSIFGGFVLGKIIDSCIIGVLCFLGLSVLQIPYPLLVSVIVGCTNVIPVFGPFIGAIPCALLILLTSPIHGLYFIIFIIVLQQLDGNIIGPKVLGNSTGLSAFWVVFSILLFGGLWGFTGMLIGVPTFAVIYYIVKRIVNYFLKKKGLPIDWTYYSSIDKVPPEEKEQQ